MNQDRLPTTLSVVVVFLLGSTIPDLVFKLPRISETTQEIETYTLRLEQYLTVNSFLTGYVDSQFMPNVSQYSRKIRYLLARRNLAEFFESAPTIFSNLESMRSHILRYGNRLEERGSICGRDKDTDPKRAQDLRAGMNRVLASLGPEAGLVAASQGDLRRLKIGNVLSIASQSSKSLREIIVISDFSRNPSWICDSSARTKVVNFKVEPINEDTEAAEPLEERFRGSLTSIRFVFDEHTRTLRDLSVSEFFEQHSLLIQRADLGLLGREHAVPEALSDWLPGVSYRQWRAVLSWILFLGVLTCTILVRQLHTSLRYEQGISLRGVPFSANLLMPVFVMAYSCRTRALICGASLVAPVVIYGAAYLSDYLISVRLEEVLLSGTEWFLENRAMRENIIESTRQNIWSLAALALSTLSSLWFSRMVFEICEYAKSEGRNCGQRGCFD